MTDGSHMTQPDVEATSNLLVPPWLARLAGLGWRMLVTVILGFVLVQLAIVLGTVTASIAIGLIVAATFAPYVKALRAKGWNRTKAAAAVSLLALVSLTALITLLVLAFAPYVGQLVTAIQDGADAVNAWLADSAAPRILTEVVNIIVNGVKGVLVNIASEVAGPIASFVTALILGAFLTFFLLQDGDKAWGWLMQPIQGWRGDSITAQADVALDRVGGYLRGTAVLAAVRAVSDFVFLELLGVPLAAPLAVLVFLCAFVPYLGGFFATVVLLLVTYAANGSTDAIILFVLITIMSLVLGRLLGPVIYGRNLNVHPALVLIALPAGAALFGAIGLFVALPVVAAVMAIAPVVVHALGLDPGVELERRDGIPVWLDRLGQWSWRGLIVVGLLALVVAAAVRIPTVVLPVVLATVLAATLDPTARMLRRRGWSPGRASFFVTIGTIIGILGVSILAIVAMIGPLGEMLGTAADGASQGVLASLGIGDVVRAFANGMLAQVANLVSGVAYLGLILLLAALLTFYFLRDGEGMWRRLVARLDPARRPDIDRAGTQGAGVLGGYMIGTGVVSLFGAVTTALIMWILGLPLILPIAVLSFFLGFIPYIGSFIATFLAFLVTVSVGTTSDIVIMAIFTIVFNIAQGNFVAPLVYGKAVSLHPAIILLAIPAGSALAGMVGMFLVVPFLGVVAVTWRTVLHQFDDDRPLMAVPGAPDHGAPDPDPPPDPGSPPALGDATPA